MVCGESLDGGGETRWGLVERSWGARGEGGVNTAHRVQSILEGERMEGLEY